MHGHGSKWISHKINIRHPGQLKKIKILGAKYLFCVKSIATYATTFFEYIISVLAIVDYKTHSWLEKKENFRDKNVKQDILY